MHIYEKQVRLRNDTKSPAQLKLRREKTKLKTKALSNYNDFSLRIVRSKID